MHTVKTITFENGQTATVLEALPTISATDCTRALAIAPYRFSIVLHVGALQMSDALRAHTFTILRDGLVRFAEDNGALIADGGTDSGFMAVMGEAYIAAGASFPLLGITIRGSMRYPNEAEAPNRYPLNAAHTHFVILDADDFGMESQVLVGMSRSSGVYGVALAINGGAITRAEIEMQAAIGTPVIVFKGTGRYADELASAPAGSELRQPFERNATHLEVFDIQNENAEALYHKLRHLLLR